MYHFLPKEFKHLHGLLEFVRDFYKCPSCSPNASIFDELVSHIWLGVGGRGEPVFFFSSFCCLNDWQFRLPTHPRILHRQYSLPITVPPTHPIPGMSLLHWKAYGTGSLCISEFCEPPISSISFLCDITCHQSAPYLSYVITWAVSLGHFILTYRFEFKR